MAASVGAISQLVARVEDAMAQVITDLDHVRIHRGEVYTVAAVTGSLNDGSKFNLHVKTAAGINELHLLVSAGGSGAAYIRLIEAPTISGNGTTVTPVNHNRITANQVAFNSAVYHTASHSGGTTLAEDYFGSGRSSSGEARSQEWVLKPNTSYIVEFESDASGVIGDVHLTMYEK